MVEVFTDYVFKHTFTDFGNFSLSCYILQKIEVQ